MIKLRVDSLQSGKRIGLSGKEDDSCSLLLLYPQIMRLVIHSLAIWNCSILISKGHILVKYTDLSVLLFYLWNWTSPHLPFPLTFFSSLVHTPPHHSLTIPIPVYLVSILPFSFIQRGFPNCRSGHVLLWLKSSDIFPLLGGLSPASLVRHLRLFMDMAVWPASSPVTLLPNLQSDHHLPLL